MRHLHLDRLWFHPNQTLGILSENGTHIAYTLERPWKGNIKSYSCIPQGLYDCVWQLSPKFGWTYQILDVPNRTRILIHAGNFVKNTYGCVLLGTRRGVINGEPAVLMSRPALTSFHSLMDEEPFMLEVKGEYTYD